LIVESAVEPTTKAVRFDDDATDKVADLENDVLPEKTEDKPAKEKPLTSADDPMLQSFLSKEMSFEFQIGSFAQCFVQKRFKTDPSASVLQFYVDIELLDKLELVYDYYVLSAHFNRSSKQLVFSQSVVKHKFGAKYVVLCVLRTKCVKPRYDIILLRVSDGKVFRLIGLTQFRKDYVYCSEEAFDPEVAFDALKEFFVANDLYWDKSRPNKDEQGNPDHETWDPSMGTATLPARKRGTPSRYDDTNFMDKNTSAKKTKLNKRGKRAGKGRGRPAKVEKSPIDLIDDVDAEVGSNDDGDSDFSDGDGDEAEMQAQIKAKKAKIAKMNKLRTQLAALEQTEATASAKLAAVSSTNDDKKNCDVSSALHVSAAVVPPVPLKSAAVVTSAAVHHSSSTASMSLLEMQVIQDQTSRANYTRDLELKNILYENLLMRGRIS
jgi:hypothetical protein